MRSFGIEIECKVYGAANIVSKLQARGLKARTADHDDENYTAWQVEPDGSINGLEIVSPRLRSLDDVKVVCEVLAECGAEIPRGATSYGLHVHLDATDLTMQQVCAVALRYSQAEDEVMAMLPRSRHSNRFCNRMDTFALSALRNGAAGQRLTQAEENHLFGRPGANTHYDGARYRTVNMMRYLRARNAANRTIEFRAHSGTVEFSKIANWVRILQALAAQAIAKVSTVAAGDALPMPIPSTGRVRRGRRTGEARVVRDNTKVLQFIEQAKREGGASVVWCGSALGWTKDNVQSWAAYVRAWGFPLVPVHAPRLPGQAGRARVIAYRIEARAVQTTQAAGLTPDKVAEVIGTSLKADLPTDLQQYIDERTAAMAARVARRTR